MRILLAEDDVLIGEGLQLGLRKEGYAVDWVQDGAAAQLALDTATYGLLLLDLGLPRQDGLMVLRRVRQADTVLPVIILTARDGVTDRVAGLDAGADDYLVKPFALAELFARIRAVSRRHEGRVQTVLRVGALSLNPVSHQVCLHDQEVAVPPKEFAVLHELMRQSEAILSREQLEEALYGWQEEVESNALQVHIHNLRKRFGPEVIRNIRGVGYQIGDLA